MAHAEVQGLQGFDQVLLVRKKSEDHQTAAQILPYQTSLSFDPQRDSDSTATKSGAVGSQSSLSTEVSVEFVNNWSKIADQLYDSLFDGDVMEFWILNRKRLNEKGQAFAWYFQGTISEDSNDNDADDMSTRESTIQVSGKPQRGWTDIPDDTKEELAYIFRGIGKVTDEDPNGNGVAWNAATDTGKAETKQASATTSTPSSASSEPNTHSEQPGA